jgi:hypothetical protein
MESHIKCTKIRHGFSDKYFGLSKPISIISVLIFNSVVGMNGSNGLYTIVNKFVNKSNLNNEKKRFNEIIQQIVNDIQRFIHQENDPSTRSELYMTQLLFAIYPFERIIFLFHAISKAVIASVPIYSNLKIEYELFNSLVSNCNGHDVINMKVLLNNSINNIFYFSNIITYTLNGTYIDCSEVLTCGKNTPNFGYIINDETGISSAVYKCEDKYWYIQPTTKLDMGKEPIHDYYPKRIKYKLYKKNDIISIQKVEPLGNNYPKINNIYAFNRADKFILKPIYDFIYHLTYNPILPQITEISSPDATSNRTSKMTKERKFAPIVAHVMQTPYPVNLNTLRHYCSLMLIDSLCLSDYEMRDPRISNTMYSSLNFIYSILFSNKLKSMYIFVNYVFNYIDLVDNTGSVSMDDSIATYLKRVYDGYVEKYKLDGSIVEHIVVTNPTPIEYRNTNKRITFIRNVIVCIIREAFRLTHASRIHLVDTNTPEVYVSHRDISHIPDATIQLCYLMYLYAFKKSNVITIFYDYPAYIVLMREMFMTKNLDIRRVDTEICMMKYRYDNIVEDNDRAKSNLDKYKLVLCKFPRAITLVNDVFGINLNCPKTIRR